MIKPKKIAIIDTGVLRNFFSLGKLNYLNLFYETVLLPISVEREFLSNELSPQELENRFDFIFSFFRNNSNWFERCNLYSEEEFQIYLAGLKPDEKKLGIGEAEVFCQFTHTQGIAEILIDDQKAYNFGKSLDASVKRTLYFLAELDHNEILNYFESCEILRNSGTRIKNDVILKAFYSSYDSRGFPVPKDRIPSWCQSE
ncbi:hypothetical protein [Leptospira santarosai]|uniref:hypothetical protein n=1 Tax=Leptospira santarosai TaxID=28183 RepID=UPI0002BF55F0|nr:hypothetical protein [Leptospira santarosai]EMO32677.1 hypothetical protein LEP1GSC175_2182 [Leptospira santarosai str. HAI821]OLY64476.1 hypothetical protein BWD11_09405 [Leptospira santarosai serovar Grippotyphosa]ONF78097.1 hypothetical protein BWD12_13370 [Leptospira santarosai serovar Bananal]UZN05962.1 hypothetical protein M5D10_08815 [Leptospira santarosai]